MQAFWQQLTEMWSKIGVQQKVTLIGVVFGLIVMVLVLGYGVSRPDYRALVSELSRAKVYEISAYLREQGIEHRVADNETSILVPSKELYGLRKNLAEQDMLGEEGDGFELLDHSSFSDSTFMEQKKYDRAVAGELERSFREINGVESARVIIVRAATSPFLDDQNHSSASVKLKMRSGARLDKRQVAGVVRLTAGAVEGLHADYVEVVDDRGPLTENDEEPGTMMANTVFEAERERENYLKKKAQNILDRILGPGRSMVNVAVDLDFTERSKAATEVDQNNRVAVSEKTTSTEESTPIPIAGGISGTQSNIEEPGLQSTKTSEPATKTLDDSATQYQVGQTVTKVREDIGHVRGMTVSIVLDYKEVLEEQPAEEATDAAVDTAKTEPRMNRMPLSDAEKKQIENSVLNAIGYYAALDYQKTTYKNIGMDRFKVSTECLDMKPMVDELEVVEASILSLDDQLLQYIRYAVAIIVVFALLLIARGQLKRSHEAWRIQREEALRAEREAAEAQASDEGSVERVIEKRLAFKEGIRKQIQENPSAAAEVLKAWIHDG